MESPLLIRPCGDVLANRIFHIMDLPRHHVVEEHFMCSPYIQFYLSLVTIKDFLIKIGKMGTDALIITDGPDWMRQFLHPLAFKYRIKLNQFFHRFTGLFRLRRCPDSPDFRFEKGLPKLCSKYANSF